MKEKLVAERDILCEIWGRICPTREPWVIGGAPVPMIGKSGEPRIWTTRRLARLSWAILEKGKYCGSYHMQLIDALLVIMGLMIPCEGN